MRKTYRITSLLLAVTLVCSLLFGCAAIPPADTTVRTNATTAAPTVPETALDKAEKDPVAFLLNALALTKEAVTPAVSDDLGKLISAVKDKGSVSLAFENEEIGSVVGQFSYDVGKKNYYAMAQASVEGETVNLELFANDKEFCIHSPEILGENAYGIRFDNLKEDLQNASIWQLLGVDYSEIQPEIEKVLEMFEKMTSKTDVSKEDAYSLARLKQLFENVQKILDTCKPQASAAGEESVVISYALKREQVDKIIEIYSTYVDDMVKYMVESLEDFIEEMPSTDEVKELLKELSGEYTIDFTVNNATGMVSGVDVTIEAAGDEKPVTVTINAVLGADPAAAKEWTVDLKIKTGDEENSARIILSNDDAEGIFDRTLTVEAEDETIACRVRIGQGSYTIEAFSGEEMVSVSGTYVLESSSLTLKVDEMTMGEDTMDIGLTVTISSDTVSKSMPQYKDILNLTQADIEELMGSLGGFIPGVQPELKTVNVVVAAEGYETIRDVFDTDQEYAYDFLLEFLELNEEGYALSVGGFAPDYDWIVQFYLNDAVIEDVYTPLNNGDTLKFVISRYTA